MGWISDIKEQITEWLTKPPEPLVLGAELWCPYGSEHSFLMLERDDIDIENLPQACVDDCKASVNIFPFGECSGGSLCEYKMELEKRWENPEPQNELVNGKEVITTKSVLLCKAGGMEIQAATSGQEFGKQLAEKLNLKAEMDAKYPGLYDLLMDPYGSLYLNEGMYETALTFLEDQIKDSGDIFLPTIFDGNDLENEMVRLALGRLIPRCDVRTYDRFINGLEDTGLLTGMNEEEGWDVHYLNNEMMEMLRKDCRETDERIKTDPEIRWQEENRVFTSSMSDAMTEFTKAVVMYFASQSQPAEKPGEKPGKKLREKPLNKIKEESKNKFKQDDTSLANTLTTSEAEEYAFGAIKGPDKANEVVLGCYDGGSETGYIAVAKEMDAQYFNIDNWDEMQMLYSPEDIWKINERFLDIQTSSGREIYLSHDPAKIVNLHSSFYKEIQYLEDNGYRFIREGDLWHAIR